MPGVKVFILPSQRNDAESSAMFQGTAPKMSWHFQLDPSSGHKGPSSSPAAFPDSSQLSEAVKNPPLTSHGTGTAIIKCVSTWESSPDLLSMQMGTGSSPSFLWHPGTGSCHQLGQPCPQVQLCQKWVGERGPGWNAVLAAAFAALTCFP